MAESESDAIELAQKHRLQREQRMNMIRKAIERFANEPQRLGLTIDYDAATDTLFAYIGTEPQPAQTEHLADHVYVRLDEADNITGFEVLDFAKNIEIATAARAIFSQFYPAIVHYQMLFLPPSSVATVAAARDIEELSRAA